MTAHGYYDDHSEYQRKVAETGSALVRGCVDAVAVPEPGETFVVADYGASTGRNSIAAVRNAIDQVRSRRPDQMAAALHNDLPTNDWNEFFTNLQTSPDSYLSLEPSASLGTQQGLAGPPVLPLVSAVSFFEPAAPAGSVHVGVSFSAAHWLRTQPTVAVPDGFYFCEATGTRRAPRSPRRRTPTGSRSSRRAHRICTAAAGCWSRWSGASRRPTPGASHGVTARLLLRAMADVAAGMAADGDLDPAAVASYILAVYARTPEEAARRSSAPAARSPTRSPSSNAGPTRSRIPTSRNGERTTTPPRTPRRTRPSSAASPSRVSAPTCSHLGATARRSTTWSTSSSRA